MTADKQPESQEIQAIQAQTRAVLNQLEQREAKTIQGLKKLVNELKGQEAT